MARSQLCYWITDLGLFRIRNVSVSGLHASQEAEFRALLQGLQGQGLLLLNLDDLEARLSHFPWAEEVVITRKLPSSLQVNVVERRPVTILKADCRWAVDANGVLLPLERWQGSVDFPLLDCGLNTEPKTGAVLSNFRALKVLPILAALQIRLPDLWYSISEVTWDQNEQLILYMNYRPMKVLFGRHPDWRKMLNLYSFLAYAEYHSILDDITAIDLRFDDNVVVLYDSTKTEQEVDS
ncbi:MAG: FtsQ-type POTRA domain-containing protein [bacterium]